MWDLLGIFHMLGYNLSLTIKFFLGLLLSFFRLESCWFYFN